MKTVVTEKGRRALAFIMAHRLGISAWYCNAGECRFEAVGSDEFVARARERHAHQHEHDADLQRLGMKALGAAGA